MKDGPMVQVRGLPGIRFEQAPESAGEGFVWLRPRFVAIRVPVSQVEPWDDTVTEADIAFAAEVRRG